MPTTVQRIPVRVQLKSEMDARDFARRWGPELADPSNAPCMLAELLQLVKAAEGAAEKRGYCELAERLKAKLGVR